MKHVSLSRLESSSQGTFGKLTCDKFIALTLELPWVNNESNISCIPCGVYPVLWTFSNRLNRFTYLLGNVSNRSGIRIHSANLASQLNGCIALGQKLGTMDNSKCVLLSRPAVFQFELMMGKEPFQLEVLDGIP